MRPSCPIANGSTETGRSLVIGRADFVITGHAEGFARGLSVPSFSGFGVSSAFANGTRWTCGLSFFLLWRIINKETRRRMHMIDAETANASATVDGELEGEETGVPAWLVYLYRRKLVREEKTRR